MQISCLELFKIAYKIEEMGYNFYIHLADLVKTEKTKEKVYIKHIYTG